MLLTNAIPADPVSPAIHERGIQWLLHSGIQEPEGGVARYHHTDRAENARVSTEITGYFISSALDLYERYSPPDLLKAAIRAGRFLCDRAWDRNLDAMPFEWPAEKTDSGNWTYFFDNGIIVRALLRLWRATGDDQFLSVAIATGESMRRDFVNTADIHPILELPSKRPSPRDSRWSRQSDCYQLKAALAWHDLAQATGDETWMPPFNAAFQRALANHVAFPEGEPGARVMDRLHAYGYFLEACLSRTSDPEVVSALRKGIEMDAALLRRVRPDFERSDVPAQLLRVRLWAEAAGAVELDREAAAEEAAWAAAYQMSGPPNVHGGFCFGSRKGVWTSFVNPVSTAFCLQALSLWQDRCAGRPLSSWHSVV